MRKGQITVRASILINRPREAVWDFTQDYSLRPLWDSAVVDAITIAQTPHREVRVELRPKTVATFLYKLDERPSKTTLVARDIFSPLFEAAGGSWIYTDRSGRTLWEQTNTIVLKLPYSLLSPLFRLLFTILTKQSMKKAKSMLEA